MYSVWLACVSAPNAVWSLGRSEGGIMDSCDLPCVWWKLNPSLLDKQVFLTTELSLEPYSVFSCASHHLKSEVDVRISKAMSFTSSFLTHVHYQQSALTYPLIFDLSHSPFTWPTAPTCTFVYLYTHMID